MPGAGHHSSAHAQVWRLCLMLCTYSSEKLRSRIFWVRVSRVTFTSHALPATVSRSTHLRYPSGHFGWRHPSSTHSYRNRVLLVALAVRISVARGRAMYEWVGKESPQPVDFPPTIPLLPFLAPHPDPRLDPLLDGLLEESTPRELSDSHPIPNPIL